MADLRPFRGIHYDARRVGDLSRVLAPPYDVLSAEDRAALESRSPCNVVRLLLGDLAWERTPGVDKYTECARLWREWRNSGVLVEDDRPSLYLYRQRFLCEGDSYTRLGLIALVKLEPYSAGVILPHEQTFSRAREDRYRLMSACRANLDSVYGLYDDPEGRIRGLLAPVERTPPHLKGSLDGQEQTVWQVTDPAILDAVRSALADTVITIADGHHRYETALRYRDEQGAAGDPERPESWVLMTLSAVQDPGLIVQPTHRLVGAVYDTRPPSLEQMIRKVLDVAADRFDIEECGSVSHLLTHMSQIAGRGQGAVGVYFGESMGEPAVVPPTLAGQPGQFPTQHQFGDPLSYLLKCKDGGGRDRASDILRLHSGILDHLKVALGAERIDITYTHSAGEAVCQVNAGNCQMAFLLNPIPVEEVYSTAKAGRKMPEKSTYFYPKLTSGLVLRSLED